MFPDKTCRKIQLEIGQINQLLAIYADLLDKCAIHQPDNVEIAALGSVLHSFYNGIENVFSVIAKEIDKQMPHGLKWHRDLLVQLSEKTSRRDAIVAESTREKLLNYLGFRHFYRHSYSFFLNWDDLKPLILDLKDVWQEVQAQIQKHLA